jgi:hypothetical protein
MKPKKYGALDCPAAWRARDNIGLFGG